MGTVLLDKGLIICILWQYVPLSLGLIFLLVQIANECEVYLRRSLETVMSLLKLWPYSDDVRKGLWKPTCKQFTISQT